MSGHPSEREPGRAARRPNRRRTAPTLLGLAVPLLTGCYVYHPTSLTSLAPGEEVRVRLTAEAVAGVDSVMSIGRDVEGKFAGLESEAFLLDVAVGSSGSLQRHPELNQRLDLPVADVVGVERRTLDQTRTGLVLAAVAAVAATAAFTAFSDTGGDTSTTPPTPGDAVIPLLTFVLRGAR